MRSLLTLAWSSLGSRRFVALLTIACIGLGSAVLIVVEQIRVEARDAFTRSVSGVDLIVGPRGGSVELLMGVVFRTGTPGRGMTFESYRRIAALPRGDLGAASQFRGFAPWLSGDGHRGGLFQPFPLWTVAAAGLCRGKTICRCFRRRGRCRGRRAARLPAGPADHA